MLEKLCIEQTKSRSRSRHSNDNALTECHDPLTPTFPREGGEGAMVKGACSELG